MTVDRHAPTYSYRSNVDFAYTWQLDRTIELEKTVRAEAPAKAKNYPEETLFGALWVQPPKAEKRSLSTPFLLHAASHTHTPSHSEWVPELSSQDKLTVREAYVFSKLKQIKNTLISNTSGQTTKRTYRQLSTKWQAYLQAVYEHWLSTGNVDLEPLEPFDDREPCPIVERPSIKLLRFAKENDLEPLSLAEYQFDQDTIRFHEASTSVCDCLCHITTNAISPIRQPKISTDWIIHEDKSLLVIDKPAGLLSVPGRGWQQQDSVVSRLRCLHLDMQEIQAVHRLDRDTSGLMVLAKDKQTHRALSEQFAQRQVKKVYEAQLSSPICQSSGHIDLPLWGNPTERPIQSVDFTHGKPAQTSFKRLTTGENPRVQLIPHTGRTHQLRVHMATGLNAPIMGDRLYGPIDNSNRLHLHACTLGFIHPATGHSITFQSQPPF